MINGAGWFLEHADPLLKAGFGFRNSKKSMEVHIPEFLLTVHQIYIFAQNVIQYLKACFLVSLIRFMFLSQKLFLSPVALMLPPTQKRNISFIELAQHSFFFWLLDYPISYLEFNFLEGLLMQQKTQVSIQPRSSGALGFAQYLPAEMSLFSKEWHEWHSLS